jgi:hypothetical protein
VSHATLPEDRPRWAVDTVRTIQAVLAALALAVLAWTVAARPTPAREQAPSRPVVVTATSLASAGYTPTPAGPPCPVAGPQKASR